MDLFLGKIFTQSNGKKISKNYRILGTVLGASASALNSCPYEAFIVEGRQMIDKMSVKYLEGNKRGWRVWRQSQY